MNNDTYSWQSTYWSALLETNPTQLPVRIIEARRDIEERLHGPIQIDGREHKAMEDAQGGLAELEAELVERNGILLL